MLYAWDARQREVDPRRLLHDLFSSSGPANESRRYTQRLVDIVATHGADIDRQLQKALTNWRLERVSAIDRNILRLGAAEMMFIPDVPKPVSIQEAILLAEKYGTGDSPRFVNGVLDALRRMTQDPGASGQSEEEP